MRLNQFISHHTKYSRREADRLIEEGRVNIEKTKATFQTPFQEDKRVFIDGKEIKKDKQTYWTAIVYHKPKGEIVSKKDEHDRKIIYDSLDKKYQYFLPVGRLDFASEGLLILTDNKQVLRALMESDLEREYIIKINGAVSKEIEEAMKEGLSIKDSKAGAHSKTQITQMDFAPFTQYSIIKNHPSFSRLKLTIKEGKNRELRRFFAYFKRDVLDLRRIRYGWVELNALPVGKTRFFNKDEYKKLNEFMKDKIPQKKSFKTKSF